MSIRINRDFDTDDVVIRIKRGKECDGFARFLGVAADGLEHGKIQPLRMPPNGNIVAAADQVRIISDKILRHNA
jgi:hypothetical protein